MNNTKKTHLGNSKLCLLSPVGLFPTKHREGEMMCYIVLWFRMRRVNQGENGESGYPVNFTHAQLLKKTYLFWACT